jgi:hypothetical protein
MLPVTGRCLAADIALGWKLDFQALSNRAAADLRLRERSWLTTVTQALEV